MYRTVRITRTGIEIDGVATYLLAGQLHYFRWTRAEWPGLLRMARAAGLNTIDTVIPWNRHEPEPGVFDFAEEADLPAFLDLCAELGLYAIVRPGPYICAEWENGGLPAWLGADATMRSRVDHPGFLAATLRWFDQLMPLLASRQYPRGGPIILCQVENEHWASGVYGHDPHQQTLAQAAIERGIEVPQYTCVGAMPGWPEFRNGWHGLAEKLLATRATWPENPLIVSELWSGWFDSWGASRRNHKTAASLDRLLHQLLAVGCSGISHWMWAGGTSFGFYGGRTVGGDAVHMTTSYDYDAPVDEYGRPTAKFYTARRHHLLLGTLGAGLSAVLADGVPGGSTLIGPAAVHGRSLGGATSYRSVRAASGTPPPWDRLTASFISNDNPDGVPCRLFAGDPPAALSVEVEAGTIRPIFTGLPLGASGITIAHHTGRLLGFWPAQAARYDLLAVYGQPGERGQLRLTGSTWHVQDRDGATVQTEGAEIQIDYWISDRPTIVRARAARDLLVVLLTDERAARWWPTSDGGFLCGPDLVTEDEAPGAAERVSLSRGGIHPFYGLAPDGQFGRLGLRPAAPAAATPLPLAWERHGVIERHTTTGWQPIAAPASFEQLGCWLGYGWYRAEFSLDAAQHTTLGAPWLNDRARLLLDGQDCGWLGTDPCGTRLALELSLDAGQHDLRLLVDNLGRFNYGSNVGERKGLLDSLYLGARAHDLTRGWDVLWQEAVFAGDAIAGAHPAHVRADARGIDLAAFGMQAASVWLLRTITTRPDRRYVLLLLGDRNPGAIFVNGVALARFSRFTGGGMIKRNLSALLRPGENVLALNIQGYTGLPWRVLMLEYDPEAALPASWSFRAGVTPADDPAPGGNGMVFHRARFRYDPEEHGGALRLAPRGLVKGQLWLNGRNLGRYWQIGPQEHYKLPGGWLRAENDLLILDETGADVSDVLVEALAG